MANKVYTYKGVKFRLSNLKMRTYPHGLRIGAPFIEKYMYEIKIGNQYKSVPITSIAGVKDYISRDLIRLY